jgi:predicted nucleotidyltransferase
MSRGAAHSRRFAFLFRHHHSPPFMAELLRPLVIAMHDAADPVAQSAAARFGRDVAVLWQAALGRDLIGVYLMGSLAHGGFSRRYSDIDIAVVTEAGVSPGTLDGVRSEAAALSAEWGPRLSVFWTDRRFALGRFPPLDRIDYLDHAVVLLERQRVEPARPALTEIRDYLADAPFARWTGEARRLACAEMLEPKDRKAYLRALLYPARFCYSWMTGRMGSNDEAVAFLRETHPAQLDVGLIASALQCRQADADPDGLFPLRTALLTHIEVCTAILADRRRPD